MLKKIFKYTILGIFSFIILSVGMVFVFKYIPVYRTPLMYIKSLTQGYSIEHKWTPLEKISKNYVKAVISAEDNKFYVHNGFDFEAIEKALKTNSKKKNKIKRGASTISQQVAKNVFLWPGRNWVRKGLEAYFTVLMEAMWSKDRIMEVYLNVIELGPGVYGVQAASSKYFKKDAAKASIEQAALVAAVLPNPILLKINQPSAYVRKRQRVLSRYVRGYGYRKITNNEVGLPAETLEKKEAGEVKTVQTEGQLEAAGDPTAESEVPKIELKPEINEELNREIEELNAMEEKLEVE